MAHLLGEHAVVSVAMVSIAIVNAAAIISTVAIFRDLLSVHGCTRQVIIALLSVLESFAAVLLTAVSQWHPTQAEPEP